MGSILKTLFMQRSPSFLDATEYVGETFETITSVHKDYTIVPYYKEEEGSRMLEIRLDAATLTCVLKNDICVEAYKFSD